MSDLSPRETIQIVQQIYTLLKLLTDRASLAGIVLETSSFDQIKREFGDAKIPYRPAELDLDPGMNDTFVVDGLLIMRGSKLQ